MSWYQDKFQQITPGAQTVNPKRTLLPITVTNLDSPLDEEKLLKALLELQGITDVKSNLAQKQLFITFNPDLVRVETIAYTISNLGYHYVQRS
jgi:copper chaperone CopZ